MTTIPRPSGEIVPKPWQSGLAPVYIGVFLWIGFFDQLGRRALPLGGLGPAILGAAIAGPLSYLLLFRSSALWGHRSGKPLDVLATSTFGLRGASLVPGMLLGFAQIIMFAVAVGYAVELTFQGLVLEGLVQSSSLRPTQFGGATLKAPLYLATALFWAVTTALVSMRFVRWIAYLMQFFPIFPAVMLGGAMLGLLVGLRSFQPFPVPQGEAKLQAFLMTLQWVFSFSAMAGVMGADWGSGSLSSKDVKLGGWVGMAFAPAIISALSLIAVAGHQGSKEAQLSFEPSAIGRTKIQELRSASGAIAPGLDDPPYTFRAAANGGFDPRIGGLMLLTFGLASLAPAVYSAYAFGLRFKALGPGISRLTWTMMGTTAAWLLIVGGWFDRTEVAFNILGAAFAPVAGALAADYRRRRGEWTGPRVGINPAGLIAWAIGLAVGLAPTLGRVFHLDRLAAFQPAALAAFVAAFLTYELLALLRLESGQAPKDSEPNALSDFP